METQQSEVVPKKTYALPDIYCVECMEMLVEEEQAFCKENTETFTIRRSGVYWTC